MDTIASVLYVTNLVSIPTSSLVNVVVYVANYVHVPMDYAMVLPCYSDDNVEPTNDYDFHVYLAFVYGYHVKGDSESGKENEVITHGRNFTVDWFVMASNANDVRMDVPYVLETISDTVDQMFNSISYVVIFRIIKVTIHGKGNQKVVFVQLIFLDVGNCAVHFVVYSYFFAFKIDKTSEDEETDFTIFVFIDV